MITFDESLKELIIEKGLSVKQIGTESGVSDTQYGRYLRGSMPTIDVAVRIANYFDVSLDYLFGLTEERNHARYVNKGYDVSGFWKRYEKLLAHNKTTNWKFAQQYGVSESNLRHWKYYGDEPNMQSLLVIAYNLSGSIDGLLGRI